MPDPLVICGHASHLKVITSNRMRQK